MSTEMFKVIKMFSLMTDEDGYAEVYFSKTPCQYGNPAGERYNIGVEKDYMIYKIRTVKPEQSQWFFVEDNNEEDAIQNFHYNNKLKEITYFQIGKGRFHFVLFEIEGTKGTFISRIIHNGIFRKGIEFQYSLNHIANILNYDELPETLLDKWEGEEPE